MSDEMNVMTAASESAVAPVAEHVTQPWYWSVRRELWENRSLYVAPVIIAGVFLFGFLLSTITLPRRMRDIMAAAPIKQHSDIGLPYSAIAFLLMMTAFIVGFFYCLDALHGERRDRSLLFWKSMPVSDRVTVLSKAAIPLVVLPVLSFVIAFVVQAIMLLASSVVLMANPGAVATLWRNLQFFHSALALLYGFVVIALWHAPIYAWLLLISAWARRAAVLWAILPFLAVGAVEKIFFDTTYFMKLLGYRVMGGVQQAFILAPRSARTDVFSYLTPLKFLSTPGLWIGLVLAALFLVITVRLRRNREPM